MKTKKICIIEDEYLLSHAMRMSALGERFEVLTAGNGKEGLELIRAEKPDLVLLDLMMPEMDGFEVMATLQKDPSIKGTRIMVLSNDATEESKRKAMKLGAIDYYIKADSDLSALAERIRKLLK